MKKYNYTLNDEGYITSLIEFPFNEKAPYIITEEEPILLVDKIINGKVVRDSAAKEALDAKIFKRKRIQQLKELLAASDFKAIKFAEGELTEEEFAPIRELRRAYREEINGLMEE